MRWSVDSVIEWWLSGFLLSSAHFLALALFAWLALGVFRRSDPRLRYAILVLVLLRLTLPWDLRNPLGQLPSAKLDLRSSPSEPVSSDANARPFRTGLLSASDVGGRPRADLTTEGGTAASPLRSSQRELPVIAILLAVWLLGATLVAVRSVARFMSWSRRVMRSSRTCAHLTARICELAEERGCGPLEGAIADDAVLEGPVLVGLVRPRVLLPSEAESWPQSQVDAAILHELAHAQRRDQWVALLAEIARACHWFNPAVWWLRRRLRTEREQCCDDWVLRHGADRRSYWKALLRTATRAPASELGMAALRGDVMRRMQRMLSEGYRPARARRGLWLGALAAMALLTLATAPPATKVEEATHVFRLSPEERLVGGRSVRGYLLPQEIDAGSLRQAAGDVKLGPSKTRLTDVLDVEGWEPATFVVEALVLPDGRVSGAVLREPVGLLEEKALLDAVAQLRYDPPAHPRHGPVAVAVTYSFELGPSVVQETLRPAVRDRVVNVIRALQTEGSPVPVEVDGLPERVRILSGAELEVPADLDRRWRGDYSVSLVVSPEGQVTEARLQGSPSTSRRLARVADGGITSYERLAEHLQNWARTLELEPAAHPTAGMLRVGAAIDVRLGDGGFHVIRYVDASEGWEEAFYDRYHLPEGAVLRLIEGPPIPERIEFLRTRHPDVVRRHPNGPGNMVLLFDDDGPVEGDPGGCYGGCGLFNPHGAMQGAVLSGLLRQDVPKIEIDPTLPAVREGDYLRRLGATPEQLLDDLVAELTRIYGFGVVWEQRTTMAPTIVLRGSLGTIREDPELDGRAAVHLYRGEKDPDPKSGAGFAMARDASGIAKVLARVLGVDVLDETTGPDVDGGFVVRTHHTAQDTELVDELLENVARQTGLEIVREERPVSRVSIRRAAG